ncbi:MAG TPA: helix-turn-helix domain-containing protein [Patescibacteria group bacterium]|nr:helix-turn-helix domain-containing protein [Patescibacteria group bacterium]
MAHKEYKTVKEIAQLLKVNPATIYEYVKNGQIPAVRLGRNYRIELHEFNRFLRRHATQ